MDDVDAGWLAVYSELGIPVIDAAGVSTIADDPIGPRWDHVWSIGGLSRGKATFPLADLGTTLGLDDTTPIDPAVLLADVRAAALSPDARVQTFGLFVAGKAVANGGADLLDPAVTADQVAMDAATVQLISWVVTRDAFRASVADDLASYTPPSGFANPRSVRRADAAVPCSEALGSADETSWINWLAGTAGGGVGVDGVVSTPGLVETLVTQMKKASEGIDAAKAAAAKAAKFVNRLNVIAQVLSLAAQVNAVQVNPSMSPDPLIRKREASDGNTATVSLGLSFSAEALNSNLQALCALSMLANAFGVGLSFPADGAPLANVEVIVTSGRNFGTKVYFGANADRKRVTDGSGHVDIEVQGKARAKTLPDSAKEKDDEFGLNFEAQVDELTGQSILNVFIAGLSLGAGAAPGAIGVAKSFHFDLGEYLFRFTDYGTGYFEVSGTSEWAFESGFGLSATIAGAALRPDESGGYFGAADVTWGSGAIGSAGCGVAETTGMSSATMTGVVDDDGVMTLNIEYTTAAVHNAIVCGPVSRESTVSVTPDPLIIVGPTEQTLQSTQEHVVSGEGERQSGVADYQVVPVQEDDEP
jgi:hypothetical protein